MAIKASILTQQKRSTVCSIIVPNDDGGGVHEEEITVVYFSPSIQWWRDHQQSQPAEPTERRDLAVLLGEIIAELPDILDDEEKPVAPTVEFLSQMMIENLRRINEAIGEDMNPEKKFPSKSLPDTSVPKGRKASRSTT